MKKFITIQKLSLLNFKGIKSLSINLESETNIFGANGTGKTTLSDAFNWLLFGKDSSDRKDFEIKTLDNNGKVIPMIEHEVEASLLVGDETLKLKRVLKENWVKKRGSETSEFSGNITDLYWNDVPVTVTEFAKKVNDVLNEQVFKMITSPIYFNSIKWQDRRNLLIQVFGEVSNEDIAKGNSAYESLIAKLTQGKSLEDYKAQIAASIKKAKEDIKMIPARVDEVFRNKPESQDFEALELNAITLEKSLKQVNDEIADINLSFESKLKAQRSFQISANNLKTEIENIESKANKEANQRLKPDNSVLDNLIKNKDFKNQELQSFQNAIVTLEGKKKTIKSDFESIETKMESMRKDWGVENAKQLIFTDDCMCPTCNQKLPVEDVENKKTEATKKFNNTKKENLVSIEVKGQNLKVEKENISVELETILQRIETGKKSIENTTAELKSIIDNIDLEKSKTSTGTEPQSFEVVYESILALDNNYQIKILELEANESSIIQTPSVDNSDLVSKRDSFSSELNKIKVSLHNKMIIETCEKRIAELNQEEKNLAQQIANVEKEQFVIENFIKDKVDRLESVVNSKFNFVKFKMFDEQINGGLKETCEAMVNGVPYSDVNTASKINAGLDIINVLSEFYGIAAPIFIDNAESVHTLIDTDSQLIRLVVSEEHKKLLVESKELVA
jgi:DNA repair exonuclease SbcCD ATPase subunit